MGREILTLQFGHKANYLATHFWNAQEASFDYEDTNEKPVIDNDVHFRAGVGEGGVETYTPRTLIYDLKGGFGSLRKVNELYSMQKKEEEQVSNWDGNVQTYSEPRVSENAYQTALGTGCEQDILSTEKVRWWSDFNRVYYHPRSSIQINQYQLNTSSFDSFTQGQELFQDTDKDEELLDRDIRPFIEESDSLQGFQVIVESDSAWGGFGAEYIDLIRGEYPKTPLWTWGIESPSPTPTRRRSFAQMISSIYESTSLYIPLLQPPHLPRSITLDPTSYWHSSALFSLAYDSITLPTRTRQELPFSMDMYEFGNRLNIHGQRKIVDPQVTMLWDKSTAAKDIISLGWMEARERVGGPSEKGFMASVVRGLCDDIDEVTKLLSHGNIVTERIVHPQLLPLPTSFPKIFPYHRNVTAVSTFSSLSSNPVNVVSRLNATREDVRGLSSQEEREEMYNSISEISEYFQEDDDFE